MMLILRRGVLLFALASLIGWWLGPVQAQPKLGAAITISGVVRLVSTGAGLAPPDHPIRCFAIRSADGGDSTHCLPDGEAAQGLAQIATPGTFTIRVLITEGP